MTEDLKKLAEGNKLLLGTQATVKGLKQGRIARVFISSNCPKDVRDDLIHYKKVSEVELEEIGMTNEEFGVLCKKPFSISVAGLLK